MASAASVTLPEVSVVLISISSWKIARASWLTRSRPCPAAAAETTSAPHSHAVARKRCDSYFPLNNF